MSSSIQTRSNLLIRKNIPQSTPRSVSSQTYSWRTPVACDTFSHQGLCHHRPLNKNISPIHTPCFWPLIFYRLTGRRPKNLNHNPTFLPGVIRDSNRDPGYQSRPTGWPLAIPDNCTGYPPDIFLTLVHPKGHFSAETFRLPEPFLQGLCPNHSPCNSVSPLPTGQVGVSLCNYLKNSPSSSPLS